CDVDERAAISAQTALHSVHSLMRPVTEGWSTRILATSAVASEGIVAFVDCCTEFFSVCTVAIEKERRRQSGIWYDELVHEEIIRRWFLRPSMQQVNDRLRERVLSGSLSVPEACRSLFSQ
ncbi:MAG: hypothetical protein ACKOAG_00820, partial [Candidatus Kapaibacterium sp.]